MQPIAGAPFVETARADRGWRAYSTLAYYAAFVALGLAAALMGPTLPGLAEHTRSSLSAISYVFSARSLGYLIGSFAGGRLYDRMRGNLLMAGAMAALAAMLLLAPVAPWLPLLFVIFLVLGLAEGVVDVGGNAMLVWVHREKVGPFMSGLHFFFGVGAFVSPFIVSAVVQSTGGEIRGAYWLLALLYVPVLLGLARVSSPAPQRAEDAGAVGHASPVLVALICLFLFLYVGAEVGFGGWVFSYIRGMKLADAALAYRLTSAFWGAFTLGRLASIPLAARWSAQTMLFASVLTCLAGLLLMLLGPTSLLLNTLGTLCVGLGMAAIFPGAISLAGQHMTMTGRVTGWFLVGSSLGGMSLPWLIGQRFEIAGPQIAVQFIGTAMALALVVLGLLALYFRRRP